MNYFISDRMSSMKPSAIREILKYSSDPEVISLAAGNPAPEAFPVQVVEKITEEILTENPIAALQYSVSEGDPGLRQTLRELLKSRYNIGREGDDLIIVSGAQQGMDLSCKCLCNEGDTIICEDPSFVGSLNAFRSYNANLVGVPIEADGISIEGLEKALKENPNTRFLYLIPNFQNPSSITMSLKKRQEVYRLARQYGVLILEDNPYGDLRFYGEDIPSIKSMDEDGIVIYCGTFSKILSPGLRVGYVVAERSLLSKLIVAKQCSDVHSTILAQLICNKFLTEYDLDAHLKMLRDLYRDRCELMLSEIEKQFHPCIQYTRPEGGLFIWCTLPEGSDIMSFCSRAIQEYKVAVVPGTAFTAVEGAPTTSFRINYTTPPCEKIVQGIQILGKMSHDLFD